MSKPDRHSDPKNISAASRTFFVTSSTWQKRPLFNSERMANLFIEVIFHYQKEGHFHLHEFTAMPDHFHILLTLKEKISVERAVQLIKGGFSFRTKKDLSSNMEIWQRGFSEYRIMDQVQYHISKRYIWNNAVKRKLVERPEEYQHWSARGGFSLDPIPPDLRAKALAGRGVDSARLKSCPDTEE